MEEITKMQFPGLQPGSTELEVRRQKLRNQFFSPNCTAYSKGQASKRPRLLEHTVLRGAGKDVDMLLLCMYVNVLLGAHIPACLHKQRSKHS